MKTKCIIVSCCLFFTTFLFSALVRSYEEAKNEHEWPEIRQGIIDFVNQDPENANRHGVAAYKGLPMLHCAGDYKDLELGQFLLDKKADPNILDQNGEPVLYKTDDLNFAQLLLLHKANVDIRVPEASVSADFSIPYLQENIPIKTPVTLPQKNPVHHWFFDASEDLDESDENDISSNDESEVCEEITTISIGTKPGKGPLHRAAVHHSSVEKFQFFSSTCKCDPTETDERGNTALLTLLIHRNQNDVLEKIKILLANVPNIPTYLKIKNHHGLTAIDMAGEYAHNLKQMRRFQTFQEYKDHTTIKIIPQQEIQPPKKKSPSMCDKSMENRRQMLFSLAGIHQIKPASPLTPTRKFLIPED